MAGSGGTIEGIDPKYLQVITKEDSAEKLLAVVDKDPKYYLFAPEFEKVREFINLLRDDLNDVISRPEKRILASTFTGGYYFVQPGDEKKYIVVENDIAGGFTINFVLSDASPENCEFKVFLADRGTPFTLLYSCNGGTIIGQTSHYSSYCNTAIIRKMNITPDIKWSATYQNGNLS